MIGQALWLVVGDVLNVQVLELKQRLAPVAEGHGPMMGKALLDQHMAVEMAHLQDGEYTDAAEGEGLERQRLALNNVGAELALAVALGAVEGVVFLQGTQVKAGSPLYYSKRFWIWPGGLLVKSTGALPTYVMAALLAEAMDHIEWQRGFRVDGFSASVNSILQTAILGLAQTLLLAGINAFGYIAPASTAQIVAQPGAVLSFFRWCFAGIPMLGFLLGAVIMAFYAPERKMPQISASLAERRTGTAG